MDRESLALLLAQGVSMEEIARRFGKNPSTVAYWVAKQRVRQRARLDDEPRYEDIEVPRNSATGFVCAFFATFMGFALIWHIWWLVGAAFLGAFVTFVVFAWRDRTEDRIPADEVARIDRANRRVRAAAVAQMQPAQ